MTPKEIYEWAVDNKCEDYEITFNVYCGSEQVELEIDDIYRPTSGFNISINLY